MKYSLICWLFGHRFVSKKIVEQFGLYDRWEIKPLDWCTRCGLSKEELKI